MKVKASVKRICDKCKIVRAAGWCASCAAIRAISSGKGRQRQFGQVEQ